MKIQFLGTAAAEGFPGIFCECDVCCRARKAGGRNLRTRSQACVDDTLLIDFPADTYLHVLRDGLQLHKIKSCILTHNHEDHLYPKELLNREPGFAHLDKKDCLTMYGTLPAGVQIRDIIRGSTLAQSGRMQFQIIRPFESFQVEGFCVTPLKAKHDPYCDPVIYLVEKDGKCLLYSNDTGYYPDETWKYIENYPRHIDLAAFDCTCGLGHSYEYHMDLPTVVKVRERLMQLSCVDENTICYVNHFSHNGMATYDDMVPIAKENGFLVTYDGLSVEF